MDVVDDADNALVVHHLFFLGRGHKTRQKYGVDSSHLYAVCDVVLLHLLHVLEECLAVVVELWVAFWQGEVGEELAEALHQQ